VPIPSDSKGSVMFEPSRFPRDMPWDFRSKAIKEIESSGIEVPTPENRPIRP